MRNSTSGQDHDKVKRMHAVVHANEMHAREVHAREMHARL